MSTNGVQIVSNVNDSESFEERLKETGVGLGTCRIQETTKSNISPVLESKASYKKAARIMASYKEQVNEDAIHIRKLGEYFDEVDQSVVQ